MIQTVAVDVTDFSSLQKSILEVEQGPSGSIDVAICNAGMSIPGMFVAQDVEDFSYQMNVRAPSSVQPSHETYLSMKLLVDVSETQHFI